MPLTRPVAAITAVFTFIFTWNDFMLPLIYLHSEDQATLAVALNAFRTQFGGLEDVHLLMALSVVTMIPCALHGGPEAIHRRPWIRSCQRMMQVIGAEHGKR